MEKNQQEHLSRSVTRTDRRTPLSRYGHSSTELGVVPVTCHLLVCFYVPACFSVRNSEPRCVRLVCTGGV